MRKVLKEIEEKVSILTYIVMLVITFSNVIGRYCLHASISFTEEITTNLFVLLSVIGTAIAARERAHLGLGAITELLPRRVQTAISAVANILGMLFGVVLLVTGISMVRNQIAITAKTTTLMWPAWVFGIFLPIGAVFIIIRFLEAGIEDFKNFRTMPSQPLKDSDGQDKRD